jgi:thiol-disulfide isomerase/thioredoxin
MKQSLLITLIAAIALIGGISARTLISISHAESKPAVLTEFSLDDLSGKTHNIKEWQGKVIVINFWATWCPPCLKEMPMFVDMQNQYDSQGLQFIGIALDEAEPVKEFVAAKKINYPILLGGEQGVKIAHDLGNIVNTVPFTVVINRKGEIVDTQMGEVKGDELKDLIVPLIAEK